MAGEHEWEQADESKKIGAGKQEQANKSGPLRAGECEWRQANVNEGGEQQ